MSIGQSIGSSLGRAIGSSLAAGGGYVDIVREGVLAGFVTFTRADASSCATYFDSAGVLQIAAANIPRKTYDPSTLALRGLMIEEARTNLCLHSRDLTNAAWVSTNVTPVKDQTGIDGVASSASKITASAGNGTCLQSVVSASAGRSTTAYVKRITGSGVIDMTQDGGTTWAPVTVTALWTRVGPVSATVTNPQIGFRVVTSGDAIAVDAVQLEAGAFATSYIPTTSAAVTRAADNGVLNTLSTIGYNALEGALYAEVMRPALGGNAFVAEFYLSSGNRIALGNNTGGGGVTEWDFYVQNASADQAWLRSATVVAGQPVKIACSWKANDFALSIDGGAAITDVSGSLPSPTMLSVGRTSDVTKWLNGYLKNLRYYPRKMNVQALTA